MTTTRPYSLEVISRIDGSVSLDLTFDNAPDATGNLRKLVITESDVAAVCDNSGHWLAWRYDPRYRPAGQAPRNR